VCKGARWGPRRDEAWPPASQTWLIRIITVPFARGRERVGRSAIWPGGVGQNNMVGVLTILRCATLTETSNNHSEVIYETLEIGRTVQDFDFVLQRMLVCRQMYTAAPPSPNSSGRPPPTLFTW